MHRLTRSAASFAIVLAAYWAYALVAVPLIEPTADAKPLPIGFSSAGDPTDPQMRVLTELFPPGSWELDKPMILESDQFKLLIREYRNLNDGRVELRPCTMIFMPEGPEAEDRAREAVVLQAPHGALVVFDRPLSIGRGNIGRLVAGQLIGPITIRSQGKSTGPEDDLYLQTRDVQMNEQQVWTPHAVEFRWGPHHGRGQQMSMKLLRGESRGRRGPSIAGIEVFELAHVERLHLELGESKAVTKAATSNAAGGTAPGGLFRPRGPLAGVPLEITCRGPFRCDMAQQIATFEDQVNVWRINPAGPADQLTCELLLIEFMNRPAKNGAAAAAAASAAAAADGRPQGQSFDVVAERIEARGNPVVLNAPSESLAARGQRLEYHLPMQRITLDGGDEVFLQQGANEIHGRGLQYQASPSGGLGQVRCGGPGWLRAQTSDRPDQILEARWAEQLLVRPHEKHQLISLVGDAQLQVRGFARLGAKQIHFWLQELPPAKPGQINLRPDRMLARSEVRIDSEQLSASVGQMEVWFEPAAGQRETSPGVPSSVPSSVPSAAPPPTRTPPAGPVAAQPGPYYATRVIDDSPWQAAEAVQPRAVDPPWQPAVPAAGPLVRPVGASSLEPAADISVLRPPRRQHFDVAGRLLRARVLLYADEQAEVAELMIEEAVELVETQTARPDERPMRVSGDRLHLIDAMRPHGAITVVGKPARFEARGLGLTGTNINLNRGTNRVWIEGAGWMDLPLERDLDGRALPTPGTLRIDWQRQMTFDGRLARFEESIVASTPTLSVRTETLEAQLQQPINFAETDARRPPPALEQIVCRGGVVMENRTFDEQRGLPIATVNDDSVPERQLSLDRLQVVDLALNMRSGDLRANGPGWVSSVRRGGADDARFGSLAMPGERHAAAPVPSETSARSERLNGLQVRFQGSITGNMHQRAMQFNDQVAAAFAPVAAWHATLPTDQPEALGPEGVVMHCDQLGVNHVVVPMTDRRAVELVASGNTVVEGDGFTARAMRMTYAEAKDLLVFEGDGRNDADLYRQQQVAGERSHVAARKILYWPKTKKLWINGARSLELSGLSTQ